MKKLLSYLGRTMKKLMSCLGRIWNWIVCRDWSTITTFISLLVATSAVVVSTRQGMTLQQALLNERYSRGVNMLGNTTQVVRLAGINELRDLAKDEPEQFRLSIVRLLSAFARQPTLDVIKRKPEQLRIDVVEAVEAITTIRDETGINLDLSGINLANALLSYWNLSRAYLFKANLSGAHLRRGKPDRRRPG